MGKGGGGGGELHIFLTIDYKSEINPTTYIYICFVKKTDMNNIKIFKKIHTTWALTFNCIR